MVDYYVYDITTGRILRTGSCPSDMVQLQVRDTNEAVSVGTANDKTMHVVDGELIDKTTTEINEELLINRIEYPNLALRQLTKTMTDSKINQALDSYFLGTVDIKAWKIANYKLLREFFYPSTEDYIDAQVKIAQGGNLKLEGQSELNAYTQTCFTIKLKYPQT